MWAASCLASCCAGCACDACRSVVSGISRRSARIAYCGLFALSLVFSEATSKFGSGLFLLVQVVLLLDFIHGWNEKWVGYDEQFWYIALLVVSLICYVATFSFSGLLFYLFAPSGHDCGLNTFFIVMTLILVFVFAIITLHPSLYLCTACTSAIVGFASEPRDYVCNGLHNHSKAVSTSSLAIGLLTTVLSVVYSAVRAGSSTTLLSLQALLELDTFVSDPARIV
ncbi:UNVERIFIED_CONTAM: Serine incorporator 3 [Sesamum radiatum]|uniref:Serine incorporator 3 n=1 Tax=Sesamum radiatum TaxID=300843 RepID=A0AAW2V9L3_SESRA